MHPVLATCGVSLLAAVLALQPPASPTLAPDAVVRLVAEHLSTEIAESRWSKIRYLAFANTPAPSLAEERSVAAFWLNQLHREPVLIPLREVAKSGGRLAWIDLDELGWTAEAWKTVASREPYHREPWLDHRHAGFLRQASGLKYTAEEDHAQMVVRADWFLRDTMETDRSQSYYDLLFSPERFVQGKRNFPEHENDWNAVFGADVILKLLRERNLQVDKGAVVEEGSSIVARQNRLLWRVPIPSGAWWKTHDVSETSGDRDFAEKLIFGFKFDAGELIANLPNGGQAYLLTDNQGKRLEVADGRFAIDSSDARDRRVRNPGSCVVCHATGINPPSNLVEDMVKAGVDIKFKDLDKKNRIEGFFLRWGKVVQQDQERYEEMVLGTSRLKPTANAVAFKAVRDRYDDAVPLRQAAVECGVSEDVLKRAVVKSPKYRAVGLVQGLAVPRRTWERETFRETMLLLSAGRN